MPVHARLREVRQVGVRDRDGVLERVGDRSEARAEDDPQPRGPLRDHVHAGRNSGPNDSGRSSSSVAVRRSPPAEQRWIVAVERHELAQPLAAAAARDADLGRVGDHRRLEHAGAAGGHEHADRRRLRALPLRVGRVLDVGAGVDRPVLGAQRGADVEPRVRSMGAAHRLARGRHQRVGAEQAVRVGIGEDLGDAERLLEAGDLLALGAQVRVRRRDALELDERAQPGDGVEVDADALPQQQVALLLDHDERAERRIQRCAQLAGVVDAREPVAALAGRRLIGAVVLDQGRPAGLLLAQLQAPASRTEIGVALAQHAAVLRPQLAAGRRASARDPGRAP